MSMREIESETSWLQVIAKCLCFLCLEQTDMRNGSLLDRSRFLQGFGLSRKDSAILLGTTDKSIAELDRQSRKKGAKSASKKKSGR
jgi:hypothetical protein